MGGAKTIEVQVIDLPWSRKDLKYLLGQAIGEKVDDRKFLRWRDYCLIRKTANGRPVRFFKPYDLAKLICFALLLRKYGNCEACQQLLIKEIETNVEYWNWARNATARDWFERAGMDRAS